MKAIKTLLVLLLAAAVSDAFTTKKRERHPAFKSAPVSMEEQTTSASATGSAGGPLFAMPPHSMAPALMHPEDAEDELDIGYGTALVSCMLSLALGFGLGYGT
jgi:hypothetical protein